MPTRNTKSLNHLLCKTYTNAARRVKGKSTNRPWLYKGLPIVSRVAFYSWCAFNKQLLTLYSNWVKKGYVRALKPSLDRKDPTKGYTLDNIRWVTLKVNITKVKRN